jgi:hypothetical protein
VCLLCSHVQGEVASVIPCTHHLGASLVQQQVNTVLQEGHGGGGGPRGRQQMMRRVGC